MMGSKAACKQTYCLVAFLYLSTHSTEAPWIPLLPRGQLGSVLTKINGMWMRNYWEIAEASGGWVNCVGCGVLHAWGGSDSQGVSH